jgi:hypothetical protein
MARPVKRIVIVGGGTAGWLAACLIAAKIPKISAEPMSITLIEAPDIPTIGVGEGTWPTMRETLAAIGIDEGEFLSSCDASFKQGSRFEGWRTGKPGDSYYHPFSPPPPMEPRALVAAWRSAAPSQPFAAALSPQPAVCDSSLAPRQAAMPAYSGALNYAYHLDAAKLVVLLRRHAVDVLGVIHVADRVDAVEDDGKDGIAAVVTAANGKIAGDLFIDCTGLKALLIEGHCRTGWNDQSHFLINDRALAVQVPVNPDSPIASQTTGTAHEAGWLWDIGLPTRRGIGCVYSSRFISDEKAREILDGYILDRLPGAKDYPVRRIEFPTGHRKRFWVGNCLAIGLSAGFIEPLEASAIVLIELSVNALTAAFPSSRERMPFLADRFNQLFTLRWQRIVEFLKLHYALSQREEPYWRAQREPASMPPRLADLLDLWRDQPPSPEDLPFVDEIFPTASYQYVYYGMGGALPERLLPATPEKVMQVQRVADRARALTAALPTNRSLLDRLAMRHAHSAREESAA